ncbi:MAG: CBS domain-containing protein [Anaerolineaceae bacterium]|nr:CBS domain-containing protein [Anaerolineaceae bacterium]MDE0330025.1 CBS domain-containing protein [Anaerolineaceae bacterium]
MNPFVSQLMTSGPLQTLDGTARLKDVAALVRRVSHDCWPVQSDAKIVGLLRRQDLDRALEHNLGSLRVRDIMHSDYPHLRETDEMSAVEAVLAQHGRDALPVLDAAGQLQGMVSRGDLLRHRTKQQGSMRRVTLSETPHGELIQHIADLAGHAGIGLWLVGGSVRDLLLGRPCDDLDFVVGSEPRRLASLLVSRLGGTSGPMTPFGTIRWFPDEGTAGRLSLTSGRLPEHIDFVGARAETYATQAALPQVFSSSLQQDLLRRDFSINALAIPVAPSAGPVVDPTGGLADLDAGVIRVLHPLSFHDDPLRILRAWRFRARFGFDIEPRTRELMQVARPALGGITGTRLSNEIDLLLQEESPGAILLAMQRADLLTAIHPDFRVAEDIEWRLQRSRHTQGLPPCSDSKSGMWHALASDIEPDRLPSICERLQIAPRRASSMEAAARLLRQPGILAEEHASTFQIVERLLNIPHTAVCCLAQLTADATLRKRLTDWLRRWPETCVYSTGHDVLAAGLSPGPAIARVLLKLRVARYEGSITSEAAEWSLLGQLVLAERQSAISGDAEEKH